MTNEKCLDIIEKLKQQSENSAIEVAEKLETFLETVAEDDGFGTERQTDPRGDGRDYDYEEDDEEVDYPSMFVADESLQHERNLDVLDKLFILLQNPDEEFLTEDFIENFKTV